MTFSPFQATLFSLLLAGGPISGAPVSSTVEPVRRLVRVASAQPKSRLVDHHLHDIQRVLQQVELNLDQLILLISKAGASQCDVVALPEDTLGLGRWEAAHPDKLNELLPKAVERMLERLGKAAAAHGLYLVCCNDAVDSSGALRNSAFLLGRDGPKGALVIRYIPMTNKDER